MLGFGPPRYSLKLGPRQAAWAVRSRDWRGRPHLWSAVVDLPSVLLRPSPVEPNISDVEALKSCLHALIGIPVGRQAPCWPIALVLPDLCVRTDRKSTRLNSSHGYISYAVFCLKKKKKVIRSKQTHNKA